MIPDQLYEAAFAFRDAKLWKKLCDRELFAVRLPDGEIGYCCVMGMIGKDVGLVLFVGAEGFQSYRVAAGPLDFDFLLDPMRKLFSQNAIQCVLDFRYNLSDEEAMEALAYARAHGIPLRGHHAYPSFVRHRPYYETWDVTEERDQINLCEALSAAVALEEMLQTHTKTELGLSLYQEGRSEEIPLLVREDGVWTVAHQIQLPDPVKETYPEPKVEDELALAKFRKLKRTGTWEGELYRLHITMQTASDEVPCFPVMLIMISRRTGDILYLSPAHYIEKNAAPYLHTVMEAFLDKGGCPSSVLVRDERTYAFLKDLCANASISLRISEKLSKLDEAEELLFEDDDDDYDEDDYDDDDYDDDDYDDDDYDDDDYDEEDYEEDYEEDDGGRENDPKGNIKMSNKTLHSTSDQELRNLSPAVQENFLEMAQSGLFSDSVSEQVLRVMGGEAQAKPVPSYVISVSIGKGCYRHIQISGSCTLEDLHLAIQDAFEFDNDHCYAFFMNNQRWSDSDAYYSRGVDDGRFADRCRLYQLNLDKGRQFKYLFDFGDEWLFQCKVLRVLDDDTEKPTVVRSAGDAPQQYPDEDDEQEDLW